MNFYLQKWPADVGEGYEDYYPMVIVQYRDNPEERELALKIVELLKELAKENKVAAAEGSGKSPTTIRELREQFTLRSE